MRRVTNGFVIGDGEDVDLPIFRLRADGLPHPLFLVPRLSAAQTDLTSSEPPPSCDRFAVGDLRVNL